MTACHDLNQEVNGLLNISCPGYFIVKPVRKIGFKNFKIIYVMIDLRYWGITTSYLSVIITSYKTQGHQGLK